MRVPGCRVRRGCQLFGLLEMCSGGEGNELGWRRAHFELNAFSLVLIDALVPEGVIADDVIERATEPELCCPWLL